MIIIGLTGSIGAGKTTLGKALRRRRIQLFDADRATHAIFRSSRTCQLAIEKEFPGVLCEDGTGIDRKVLGARVFGNKVALRRLEQIVHPHVRASEQNFLSRMSRHRMRRVVLDIPLLFETGAERRCDHAWIVLAPRHVLTARVIRRKGMNAERLAAIRARQLADRSKLRRADFIVRTGLDRRMAWRDALRALRKIKNFKAWSPGRRGRRTYRSV